MNNVAEGFDSASRAEFTRFLRYASRSASEVQSCLYVASDQGYIDPADFDSLYRQAASVRKLCVALIRALNRPSPRSEQVNEPATPYGPELSDPAAVSVAPGHRSPVTGHASSSDPGHRSPVTGHASSSDPGHRSPVTGHAPRFPQ
jgi:hypothetical protein